jgi:hypothetical protein
MPEGFIAPLAFFHVGAFKTVPREIHLVAIGAVFRSRTVEDQVAILRPADIRGKIRAHIRLRRSWYPRHGLRKFIYLFKKGLMFVDISAILESVPVIFTPFIFVIQGYFRPFRVESEDPLA